MFYSLSLSLKCFHFSRLFRKKNMGTLIPLEMGLNEYSPLTLAYRARFNILIGDGVVLLVIRCFVFRFRFPRI